MNKKGPLRFFEGIGFGVNILILAQSMLNDLGIRKSS